MKEYDVQASFWNNPAPFTAATSRNDVSIMVTYTLGPLQGYIIFIFLLIYTLWHTPAADHLGGGQHRLVATWACFGFTSSDWTVALALLAGKRGKLTASGCGRGESSAVGIKAVNLQNIRSGSCLAHRWLVGPSAWFECPWHTGTWWILLGLHDTQWLNYRRSWA